MINRKDYVGGIKELQQKGDQKDFDLFMKFDDGETISLLTKISEKTALFINTFLHELNVNRINKKYAKEVEKDVLLIKPYHQAYISKVDRMLLAGAYLVGRDVEIGERVLGWTWEGDHFHTKDGTVIRRSDYIDE